MIWWILIGLFVLWVAFNFFAPLSVVMKSGPISPKQMTVARLPGHILFEANVKRVRFYRAKLYPRGYACAIWSWPCQYVLMDDYFMTRAPAELIQYTLAHELGHCVLGGPFRKWLSVVLLTGLIPPLRRWIIKVDEEAADRYAERLTGISRVILRGNPAANDVVKPAVL